MGGGTRGARGTPSEVTPRMFVGKRLSLYQYKPNTPRCPEALKEPGETPQLRGSLRSVGVRHSSRCSGKDWCGDGGCDNPEAGKGWGVGVGASAPSFGAKKLLPWTDPGPGKELPPGHPHVPHHAGRKR